MSRATEIQSEMFVTPDFIGGAQLSDDGRYRYSLWRRWDTGRTVNFLMLNPSTADASLDDPTIRRCIGFAKAWEFSGLIVTNLFAQRATDPGVIRRSLNPIGDDNDHAIEAAAASCNLTVCAWGNHGAINNRSKTVRRMLAESGVKLHALKLTGAGEPQHPLYLRADLKPFPLEESST